ncbi:MAG: hypothetical protein IKL10_06170 [Clostridia bacterium]|nr:hypothetical protein [Clostridia bacterium]
MKKLISVVLALCVLAFSAIPAFAVSFNDGKEALDAQFVFGEGPKADGNSIDYRFFSPVKDGDTTKYPLVVWLHGMSDGTKDGVQISKSNISYWTSEEFQSRFINGGAFIMAARSREEKGDCWSNNMIEPLKAAIDTFIAENIENIDLTRIYVGGYSMGGKMTFKMAIAYPEMFAAAFPICPAWSPSVELLANLADMPVWITSAKADPLVNYFLGVTPTWEKLTGISNVPETLRLSSLTKVCYEDGKRTSSSHHAWFAVNHDMFSNENGDYPYMSTVDGNGNEVTLTYPDGMISWLSSHTSDYNGEASVGKGNLENASATDSLIGITSIIEFFKGLFNTIKALFALI